MNAPSWYNMTLSLRIWASKFFLLYSMSACLSSMIFILEFDVDCVGGGCWACIPAIRIKNIPVAAKTIVEGNVFRCFLFFFIVDERSDTLFYPSRVFKVAILPCRINTHICVFYFFAQPLIYHFLPAGIFR